MPDEAQPESKGPTSGHDASRGGALPSASGIDPVLHQPTRLEIVAYLYRNRQASFTELRDSLGLTAGNLQSHGEKLAKVGYIEMQKVLVGIFEVRWRMTAEGDRAFEAYFQQMRAVLERLGPVKDDDP